VRSEQTSQEQRRGGDGAEGIPGALSNQPPGTSGAPVIAGAATPGNPAPAGSQTAQGTGPSSTAQKATRNFEVDRKMAYVKQPVGVIKRLSVGVVLDDWQKADAEGKLTASPMSDADVKRFSQLVRESIGLKDDRGDQLNVINQTFTGAAAAGPVSGIPIWQAPWVIQLAKQLLGAALVLVVAFMVLKPLMKSLTARPGAKAAGSGAAEIGELDGDKVSLSGQQGKGIRLQPSFEQQVAAARTLVVQDPRRAAQVVKDWVSADG
jgi:flagellar M-ring protein FliF